MARHQAQALGDGEQPGLLTSLLPPDKAVYTSWPAPCFSKRTLVLTSFACYLKAPRNASPPSQLTARDRVPLQESAILHSPVREKVGDGAHTGLSVWETYRSKWGGG